MSSADWQPGALGRHHLLLLRVESAAQRRVQRRGCRDGTGFARLDDRHLSPRHVLDHGAMASPSPRSRRPRLGSNLATTPSYALHPHCQGSAGHGSRLLQTSRPCVASLASRSCGLMSVWRNATEWPCGNGAVQNKDWSLHASRIKGPSSLLRLRQEQGYGGKNDVGNGE